MFVLATVFGAAAGLLRKYLVPLAAVVIGVLLLALVVQSNRLERARTHISNLNTKAATLQAERERQRAEDERHWRAVEGQLRDAAAAIQRESHETERALRTRADALARELRNRPERPAAGGEAAADATAAAGCTGAGLYQPDAAFLVGEAAAAAQLGRERDECRALYQSVEQALKQYLGINK